MTGRRGAHILRHSLAVRLPRSGQTLKSISDLPGHRRPDTTFIYSARKAPGRRSPPRRAGPGGGVVIAAGRFCGPLAGEFAAFAATLEASATASKTILTQLRALDRYTAQRGLPSGTIDENLAKAWLADCAARAPNTRRARYYLLRRFCRFLAARCPGTFAPGESLRPRRRPPKLPHIYTRDEVRALLAGALALRDWTSRHPCPIRSATCTRSCADLYFAS